MTTGDLPKAKIDLAEVRATIVAEKSGNPDGVKGGRKAETSSNKDREERLASVSQCASSGDKQAREAKVQKYGAKLGVWSKKMLEALERGIKGKKWFSLMDKVYKEETLQGAWEDVASNAGAAGTDKISVTMYGKTSDERLRKLSDKLKSGTYSPESVRRVYIQKLGSAKQRPLGIPTVEDRVVQTALKMVIEPIFEKEFAEHSYGFRPARGCKDALRQVDRLLKQEYLHVVDVDIKGFFDNISHQKLMSLIGEQVADGKVLKLTEGFLTQKVRQEDGSEQVSSGKGTPQGGVISPLLANIYLNSLDWLMKSKGFEAVRYADDIVVLCKDSHNAEIALYEIQRWMQESHLELNLEKTKIVNMAVPGNYFDFLGYRFWRSKSGKIAKFIRPKSGKKFRDKIRPLTKRCNGYCLKVIIKRINPTLRGHYEYFKHCAAHTLRKTDEWVRGRLRNILRKRLGRKGRANGTDHQTWLNAYFTPYGLFSLEQARKDELSNLLCRANC